MRRDGWGYGIRRRFLGMLGTALLAFAVASMPIPHLNDHSYVMEWAEPSAYADDDDDDDSSSTPIAKKPDGNCTQTWDPWWGYITDTTDPDCHDNGYCDFAYFDYDPDCHRDGMCDATYYYADPDCCTVTSCPPCDTDVYFDCPVAVDKGACSEYYALVAEKEALEARKAVVEQRLFELSMILIPVIQQVQWEIDQGGALINQGTALCGQ